MTADTAEKKLDSNNMEMAKSSASDNPKTTNKKQTLLTIPTEVLENIASFTDSEDLLNLRLANREVADRTFDAFAKVFLETLYWEDIRLEKNLKWVDFLNLNSRFAQSVKRLIVMLPSLKYTECEPFIDDMGVLQNLRSLTLQYCDEPPHWTPSVNFPRLEEFIVSNCIRLDHRLVVYFIQAHTASLKSVDFKRVDLATYNTDGKASWLQVLESCEALRPEAIIKISAPTVQEDGAHVAFSPPLKECNPNIHPLEVFIKEKFPDHGLYYSTKPGNLQMSLDFMTRHYKELETDEERREYGVGPKIIYNDTDDDSEEEEEEEEEDDFEEERDDSGDEDEN